MYTIGAVSECRSVNNTIMADYNAGGIVGGSSAYSLTSIDLCENNSSVTAGYAGAGGIIGVADTLSVTTSTNLGLTLDNRLMYPMIALHNYDLQ